MAKKDPFAFNFGANAKPKKAKGSKGKKAKSKGGSKGNAWRSYIGGGISSAPIPD